MADLSRFKPAYSRFLAGRPGSLHFAAHSHHFWPDITREAALRYWDDAAREVDDKWGTVLGEEVPRALARVARTLNLRDASSLTTAPNTHEFVTRLLSCFPPGQPIEVLTTDSEFHSFTRQIARIEEETGFQARVHRIPTEPFADLDERLFEALSARRYDLVFMSHVFFNSGWRIADLSKVIARVNAPETLIVIDGYHAFCALPTDLSAVQDRIFYLGGGYKYAQAGEGACFLHVPRSALHLRPWNTGWFADFAHLDAAQKNVAYAPDATRFAGSTFDPSGWYRFNAVMDWWERDNIRIEDIHAHVQSLQQLYLDLADDAGLRVLSRARLVPPEEWTRMGHFLTFRVPDAPALTARLREQQVFVDSRGDRLRLGFGLYHDDTDIRELTARLKHTGA